MRGATDIGHQELHRALVSGLASKITSGRALWPVSARLTLLMLKEVGILAWVISHTTNNFVARLQGVKGQYKDDVYKFVVGRTTEMNDAEIGNQMGVNTWGTFAGSDDKAVVDGAFAMRESELQPVLRALRKAGINIVAIHQHMVGEHPRIMFLHYWGVAPTTDLATGLSTALDVTRQ